MRSEHELVRSLDRLLRERAEDTACELTSSVSPGRRLTDPLRWSLTPGTSTWVSSVRIDRIPFGHVTFTVRDPEGGTLVEAESLPEVGISPATNGFFVNGKELSVPDLADLLWSYLTRPMRVPPQFPERGQG